MKKKPHFPIFIRLSGIILLLAAFIPGSKAHASPLEDPFLPGGWSKSGSNPLLSKGVAGAWDDKSVFTPSVILDGSTYKMWYAGSSSASSSRKIGIATSPDGITWTKSGSAPVLSPGTAGSWDASGVSFPVVIKDGTTYKMWYTGMDASSVGRIGYATSTNGTTWTKYAGNPVLNVGAAAAWDSVYAGMGSVVKVGSSYKLWYRGGSADGGGIGFATSPDGIVWTKSGSSAVLPNLGYDWDSTPYHPSVIYDGMGYHMWYSGCEYNGSPCVEGYATSPDGAVWTRSQAILPLGAAGAFDDESTDHAQVLLVGRTLKMYYSGSHAGVYAIGLASAPAPLVDISYTWHTFYGTSSINDLGNAVATDAEGNSYVLGSSMLTWNGPANQPPLHTHNPGSNADVFIMKLNSAGEYQWHTFYGGLAGAGQDTNNSVNDAYDIELDPSGNIYVMGTSRHSWGTPKHAHNEISNSLQGNFFILKLDKAGAYQWHTFFEQQRSQASSGGRKLAVDASGNAYVATTVKYPWSDTTLAPLHAYSGIVDGWEDNMLILKVNSAGVYQWHTFYGTQDDPDLRLLNTGMDIAVDAAGNAYVTGGGTEWGSPLHGYEGGSDIIVLKLNTVGAYQWHTYYGSDKVDEAEGITLDRNGFIYISGVGRPFLGPSGQEPLHPFTDDGETAYNDDTFVLKLSPSGGYVWHTWYGSPGEEQSYSNKPVTDSKGNVYVIGKDGSETSPFNGSSWNGPDGQAPLRPYRPGSNNNYFVLKLTGDGGYQWHMFFISDSFGFDLTFDRQDNQVMVGTSKSVWNGPAGQLPLHTYLGSAYITRYSYDLFSMTNLAPIAAASGGGQINLSLTGKKFLEGAVVQWNGTPLSTNFVNSTNLRAVVPNSLTVNPGVYAVRVVNPAPAAATSNESYVFLSPSGAGVTSQGSGSSNSSAGSATASAYGITASGAGSGTVVVARYSANPGGTPGYSHDTGAFTDVHSLPGSAFSSLTIINCALNGGNVAYWWNGSLWQLASAQSYDSATGCATITVNAGTSPSLNELMGTFFGTGLEGGFRLFLPMILKNAP